LTFTQHYCVYYFYYVLYCWVALVNS